MNTILALIFTIVILVSLFFSLAFLLYRFPKLEEDYYVERFGSLYDKLNLKKGRCITIYIAHFFIRRFLISVAVVFSDFLYF